MNLYDIAGGSAAFHRMTSLFLTKAQADPLLGAMFAGLDDHAEHIAAFFIANFGGPDDYFRERGDLRFLLSKHIGLHITENQRSRWVQLMTAAARDTDMPETFINHFTAYLQGPSRTTTHISNLEPAHATSILTH